MKRQGTPNDDSTPTHLDKAAQPPPDVTPTNEQSDDRSTKPRVPLNDPDDGEAYFKQHYPPSWTNYEQMAKELAQYKVGTPFHRCGLCSYYADNRCRIVRGYISASMGCKYFSQKYDAARFKGFVVRLGK